MVDAEPPYMPPVCLMTHRYSRSMRYGRDHDRGETWQNKAMPASGLALRHVV